MTRHIASSPTEDYDEAMAYAASHGPPRADHRDGALLELRASDADRDRTATVLGNALAAGKVAVHRGHYDPHGAHVPAWPRQLAAGSSGDDYRGRP
jgi:hypothetical protein